MTRDEAQALAVRVNSQWPTTSISEWTDSLQTLDVGAAGTAYVRLRDQHDSKNPPSIAAFRKLTQSLDTRDRSQPTCPTCDGSGWQPAPDRQDGTIMRTVDCDACADNDPRLPCSECAGRRKVERAFPHLVSQVKPCTCDEGRRRAESTAWRDRRAS